MKFNKGQTLIEVLVAFGIAVTLVSVITVTVIFALSSTQFSKNKSLATQYAQEGMEIARRIRDAGKLPRVNKAYCFFKESGKDTLTSRIEEHCVAIEGSSFIREVFIGVEFSGCHPLMEVRVAVFWSDNKCGSSVYCNKTEITSCL